MEKALEAFDSGGEAAARQWIKNEKARKEVTLTAGVTSTVYVGPNVNELAQVFLFPKTANAAAALATTYAAISRIAGVNTVTITHANAGTTDRTFAIAVIGG